MGTVRKICSNCPYVDVTLLAQLRTSKVTLNNLAINFVSFRHSNDFEVEELRFQEKSSSYVQKKLSQGQGSISLCSGDGCYSRKLKLLFKTTFQNNLKKLG